MGNMNEFYNQDKELFNYFCESRGVRGFLEKNIFNNPILIKEVVEKTYPNNDENKDAFKTYLDKNGLGEIVDTQVIFSKFMEKLNRKEEYNILVKARLESDSDGLTRIAAERTHKMIVGSDDDTTLIELAYELLAKYYDTDDLFKLARRNDSLKDRKEIGNYVNIFYSNINKSGKNNMKELTKLAKKLQEKLIFNSELSNEDIAKLHSFNDTLAKMDSYKSLQGDDTLTEKKTKIM